MCLMRIYLILKRFNLTACYGTLLTQTPACFCFLSGLPGVQVKGNPNPPLYTVITVNREIQCIASAIFREISYTATTVFRTIQYTKQHSIQPLQYTELYNSCSCIARAPIQSSCVNGLLSAGGTIQQDNETYHSTEITNEWLKHVKRQS